MDLDTKKIDTFVYFKIIVIDIKEAILNEQYELFIQLEKKGIIHWESIIMYAALSDKWNSVYWLIKRAESKGHKLSWNAMLYNAAFNLHESSIKYFIQKGALTMYGRSGAASGLTKEDITQKEKNKYKRILKKLSNVHR